MSYEGRVLFICENGHTLFRDAYFDYFENEPTVCRYCGSSLKRVGGIDDTNGDSIANFYLEKIEEGYRKEKMENGVLSIEYKPSRYKVIHIKRWCNFDRKSDI